MKWFWLVMVGIVCVRVIGHATSLEKVENWSAEIGQEVELEVELGKDINPDWSGRFFYIHQGLRIRGDADRIYLKGEKVKFIGELSSRVTKEMKEEIWLEVKQIVNYGFKSHGHKILEFIRKDIAEMIMKVYSPNNAALVLGLIWGNGQLFEREEWELFRKTGTTHMVVASGYNLTLFASTIGFFTEKILRKKYLPVVVIFCTILYAFILGFTVPVVRAAALAVMANYALLTGRRSFAKCSLLILAAFSLILKPDLFDSTSFQLSFLATAGLLMARKARSDVLSLVYQNISIVVWTLPVLTNKLGYLSLITIPANVLLASFLGILTLIMFVFTILGFFFSQLTVLGSWLAEPFLELAWRCLEVLGNLPLGLTGIPQVPPWFAAGYYLILLIYFVRRI